MARVLQEELITADMAAPGGAGLAVQDSSTISVTISPRHADTSGWTVTMWFRASPASEWLPDSLDVVAHTVTGTGLAARILASTKTLIFDNPGAHECYVQVASMTGATTTVLLTVTAD